MATYRGTVQRNDLEGGFLELATDSGEIYRLAGETSGARAGQRVVVRGTVERGGFGIHMSGPSLQVESIEPT